MAAYLASAASAIFLSVVVSLLIPDGRLNKTVTFVMRMVCIFVLIQPVATLFDIPTSGSAKDASADYQYICNVYSEHQSGQMEELIFKQFGAESDCLLEVQYSDGQFKVISVEVELVQKNSQLIDSIYAYLEGLGYINISVYAESA